MFASDNGGCPEEDINTKFKSTKLEDFGTVASYEAVEEKWATVQNTPLRKWKTYSHEGGIRTPLIVHWPAGIKKAGSLSDQPGHLIDIMPTLVELTGATYPGAVDGKPLLPMQGVSLLPAFNGKQLVRPNPIYWQYKSGGAIRDGQMKAVFWDSKGQPRQWELYDFSRVRNETDDLSQTMPEKLEAMKKQWQEWYDSVSAE